MFGLAALLFLALFAWHRVLRGHGPLDPRFTVLTRSELAFVRAAGQTFFPGPPRELAPEARTALPAGEEVDLAGALDRYLNALPRGRRRLVRALLLGLEQSPLLLPAQGLGGFRRFSSLDERQRAGLLQAWSESRLEPRRIAFTALKALLVMAYFQQRETLSALELTPFEIEQTQLTSDLLYPRIGEPSGSVTLDAESIAPGPRRETAEPLRVRSAAEAS